MTEEIRDMHKGWNSLAAEMLYTAMQGGPPKEELDFYERRIRKNGGIALDQACGTGRHIFPLMEKGLEVHGADISIDALNLAEKEAERQNVNLTVFHQEMEVCDLPHKYGTIFSNSFQVIDDREKAITALQRFRKHLVPGGQLLLELFIPWQVTQGINCNDADHPTHWQDMPIRDGDGEVKTTLWSESVDLFEQVLLSKRQYDVYIDGECVRSETHAFRLRWYFHREFIMMLENTGYDNITTYGDYTDNPANQDSKVVIYGARNPKLS